jgi:DNA-binding GntR family transcriptional regulator
MNGRSTSALGAATRAEAATEELRRRILEGELVEGFQLKQDLLAEEFGISRIPVREALVQLENEGLVKIVPHKGRLLRSCRRDIEELFSLRAARIPSASAFDSRLTKDDFDRLDEILKRYAIELAEGHSHRWGELNTELHDILLGRANRPRSLDLVQSLLRQTDRYTRVQLSISDAAVQRAKAEHEELVRLCRLGESRRRARCSSGISSMPARS